MRNRTRLNSNKHTPVMQSGVLSAKNRNSLGKALPNNDGYKRARSEIKKPTVTPGETRTV